MTNNEQVLEIISVNISAEKGVVKNATKSALINKMGIDGDAHSGDWHRQISLLAEESVKRFEKIIGRKLEYGIFAENLTTRGVELRECKIGDRFVGSEVVLEVTQIGKKCHGTGCAIHQAVGSCVMPVEGIFCKVISGGKIESGTRFRYVRVSLQ